MRSKEEILGEFMGKELREIAEYTGFDKMEVKVRAGTLEVLIDIRDILRLLTETHGGTIE